jgi:hypothetical protein
MKKLMLVCLPLLLFGCKKPTPEQIEAAISIVAYNGTYQGLKYWAKTNPAGATEAATALSRNLNDEIIPYLNGASLKTSAEINEFISSSLFKNVPDQIKSAIVAAAAILDMYLPIPSASTLKPEQLMYLKAFMVNVKKGSDKFLTPSNVNEKIEIQRRWIKGDF